MHIDTFFVLFDVNESESISYDEMRSGLYRILLYYLCFAFFRHFFLLFFMLDMRSGLCKITDMLGTIELSPGDWKTFTWHYQLCDAADALSAAVIRQL
jgi:hypothetical protein